jgi:hypothetical protein
MEPEEIKYCEDCKWYKFQFLFEPECGNPECNKKFTSTMINRGYYVFCTVARKQVCKMEGKFFESE